MTKGFAMTVPPEGTYPPPPEGNYQPPIGGPVPPPAGGVVPLAPHEERQWAGLAHLLGGIFSFLAPLIVWLVFKDRSAYVDAEAKKALNFQIWVTIGLIVSSFLIFLIIGIFTYIAIWIASLVFGIKNFQAVNKGQATAYPISAALVK